MNTYLKAAVLLVLFTVCLQPASQKSEKGERPADEAIQEPDQISRRDYMRAKLMYSQNILEGLTTNDFKQIENAVKQLDLITAGEKWTLTKDDEYLEHTNDFRKSTAALLEAAKSRNLDATALRFHQMSIRCIDCHKHVRASDLSL